MLQIFFKAIPDFHCEKSHSIIHNRKRSFEVALFLGGVPLKSVDLMPTFKTVTRKTIIAVSDRITLCLLSFAFLLKMGCKEVTDMSEMFGKAIRWHITHPFCEEVVDRNDVKISP